MLDDKNYKCLHNIIFILYHVDFGNGP